MKIRSDAKKKVDQIMKGIKTLRQRNKQAKRVITKAKRAIKLHNKLNPHDKIKTPKTPKHKPGKTAIAKAVAKARANQKAKDLKTMASTKRAQPKANKLIKKAAKEVHRAKVLKRQNFVKPVPRRAVIKPSAKPVKPKVIKKVVAPK